MKLVRIENVAGVIDFLWELMAERPRESWISHKGMPTRAEHAAFVHNHPYRFWFLIEERGDFVGSLVVSKNNELGIAILKKHQRRHYATRAIQHLRETLEPLPALTSERPGKWVANIAIENTASKLLWAKLGFAPVQETWEEQ